MENTQAASSSVCAACGNPATTRCAGYACNDRHVNTPSTYYCNKACQRKDWTSHKQACQSIQGRKKLSRAAELLQEVVFAIRAEVFDLNVTKVEPDEEAKLHLFDAPFGSPLLYGPATGVWMDGDDSVRGAVLSYCSGGDVFADGFYDVCFEAFKGYTSKVEEVDVRMLNIRVQVGRHCSHDKSVPALQNTHHVICVTLKDGTTWVVDPAGVQHGQTKPFLPFAEYERDYVAKLLARSSYGTSKLSLEKFTIERHPSQFCSILMKDNILIAEKLSNNLGHVSDEFAEWQVKHGSIKSLIEAAPSDYVRLRKMLVDHLATAARESTKLCNGDATSAAKPIFVNSKNTGNLSEEDRAKLERKKERQTLAMSPSERELVEKMEAEGVTVLRF